MSSEPSEVATSILPGDYYVIEGGRMVPNVLLTYAQVWLAGSGRIPQLHLVSVCVFFFPFFPPNMYPPSPTWESHGVQEGVDQLSTHKQRSGRDEPYRVPTSRVAAITPSRSGLCSSQQPFSPLNLGPQRNTLQIVAG